MEKKTFKAINFDLDTHALEEYYPKSRRNAYLEIENFLKCNGFSHRQWPGYVSDIKMDSMDVSNLNDELWNKFPWLEQCANKFDVTDIGKSFDLKLLYQEKENHDARDDINFSKSGIRDSTNKTVQLTDQKGAGFNKRRGR